MAASSIIADDSGLNQALYTGEISYVPVVNASAWQVVLGGIKVDGQSIDLGETRVVHFHTDGWIEMRESLADRMMASVPGAKYLFEDGVSMYLVPCNTSTTLTFTFGGKDYDLPPAAWVLSYDAVYTGCSTLIVSFPDHSFTGSPVYLGAPFLSSVYTVLEFDNETQIGFANLSEAARAVVPERIEGDIKPTGSMPGSKVLPQSTSGRTSGADSTLVVGALNVALAVLGAVLKNLV